MNNRQSFILLISLLWLAIPGFGQENDAGLWISANLEKSFSQAFSVSYTQELRMAENISEASVIFGDLGLDYRLNKQFKIAGHYRWIFDHNLDDSYTSSNRFYLDLSYKGKLKPVSISLRERVQSEFVKFNSTEKVNPEIYSRTKATLKFDLDRKISPYLYTELFHPLNTNSLFFFDKIRYSAGLEYQINKRHVIDLGYMIQHKYQNMPANDFVITAGYTLSF